MFDSSQLTQIKRVTLARALCDNGDNINRVQSDVFLRVRHLSGYAHCSSVPGMDLRFWKECCGGKTLLYFTLLCFALLCFALLCFALLCFALLCFALPYLILSLFLDQCRDPDQTYTLSYSVNDIQRRKRSLNFVENETQSDELRDLYNKIDELQGQVAAQKEFLKSISEKVKRKHEHVIKEMFHGLACSIALWVHWGSWEKIQILSCFRILFRVNQTKFDAHLKGNCHEQFNLKKTA